MLEKLLDELIYILEQEAAIYSEIFKISKDKTRVIIDGKVAELDKMVKQEQEMVLKLNSLEDVRSRTVSEISRHLGVNTDTVTISQIINSTTGVQQQRLRTCQDKLVEVIDGIRNSNELNSKLLKNSLDFVNFSINIIAGSNTGDNNYGNTGRMGEVKKRSFFDVKL